MNIFVVKYVDNMKIFSIIIILQTFLISSLSAQNQKNEADAILGIWLTGSKKGKVEIYKCGNEYCGKIVWLREPNYEDGSEKVDKNNPTESLRKRKIYGMNILSGFTYDEDFEWEDGDIYDPDNGKTYSCLLELQEDKKTLEVRGYVGISLIGRTDYWIRSSLD